MLGQRWSSAGPEGGKGMGHPQLSSTGGGDRGPGSGWAKGGRGVERSAAVFCTSSMSKTNASDSKLTPERKER
jgi:hypothetical protein